MALALALPRYQWWSSHLHLSGVDARCRAPHHDCQPGSCHALPSRRPKPLQRKPAPPLHQSTPPPPLLPLRRHRPQALEERTKLDMEAAVKKISLSEVRRWHAGTLGLQPGGVTAPQTWSGDCSAAMRHVAHLRLRGTLRGIAVLFFLANRHATHARHGQTHS